MSRKTSPNAASSGYGSGESDQEQPILMSQSYTLETCKRPSRYQSRRDREVLSFKVYRETTTLDWEMATSERSCRSTKRSSWRSGDDSVEGRSCEMGNECGEWKRPGTTAIYHFTRSQGCLPPAELLPLHYYLIVFFKNPKDNSQLREYLRLWYDIGGVQVDFRLSICPLVCLFAAATLITNQLLRNELFLAILAVAANLSGCFLFL